MSEPAADVAVVVADTAAATPPVPDATPAAADPQPSPSAADTLADPSPPPSSTTPDLPSSRPTDTSAPSSPSPLSPRPTSAPSGVDDDLPDADTDADADADADADEDTEPPLISPASEPDSDPSSSPPLPSLPPTAAQAADLELERYNALVQQAGQQQRDLTMALDDLPSDDDPSPDDPPVLNPTILLASPTSAAALSSLTAASATHLPAASPVSARRGSFATPDESPLSPAIASVSALDEAKAECEALLTVNKARQRQIAVFLEAQHRHTAAQAGGNTGEEASHPIKTDYLKLLTQIHALWDDLSAQQAQSESHIAALIHQLNVQDTKGEALASSLHTFQLEIARTALDRHGSPLKLKALERLHAEDAALSKALADVRLHYLTQQAKVDAVQAAIKEKEELAEGLHLIDFEQLKIENATLHEKVEERQDEIYKLRKKKNAAVEVLTHVREKVWFVYEENEGLRGHVAEEEKAIQDKRAEMKTLKAQREALRRDNESLKVKEGFVGLDALVLDYEKGREQLKRLQEEVSQRQAEYQQLKGKAVRPPPKRPEEHKEQLSTSTSSAGRLTPTLTIRR